MVYRQITDLAGENWSSGAVSDPRKSPADTWDIDEVRAWYPAVVPGNVRADLVTANQIPDPFVGLNNKHSQWIDDHDWWYRRTFSLALEDNERAFLVFNGIDYLSAVFLDGQLLGQHEGMFSRQIYEITSHLQTISPEHVLSVRIVGPSHLSGRRLNLPERVWEKLTRKLSATNSAFPERSSFLKCQMGFGWDFAPRMRTIGIWDDVTVIVMREVLIRDVHIRTITAGKTAMIDVTLTLDSQDRADVSVQIEVREQGLPDIQATRSIDVKLEPIQQDISTRLELNHPKLWQPWDRGIPHIYDLEVRVIRSEKENPIVLDTLTQSFGIRDIDFALLPGGVLHDEPWQLTINGHPEFLRGANWIPLNAMPGRLRKEDYESMLGPGSRGGHQYAPRVGWGTARKIGLL